jgi:hypothetical protein
MRQAKEMLTQLRQVRHQWSIDENQDHCILHMPEESEDGFPITVEVWPDEMILAAGGAHMNLRRGGDAENVAARTLRLVRDLLAPGMRIRERLAGGRPYKWTFERYQDGRWACRGIRRSLSVQLRR